MSSYELTQERVEEEEEEKKISCNMKLGPIEVW